MIARAGEGDVIAWRIYIQRNKLFCHAVQDDIQQCNLLNDRFGPLDLEMFEGKVKEYLQHLDNNVQRSLRSEFSSCDAIQHHVLIEFSYYD